MSRLRLIAGQSPAIVISIVALACALGGSAYATAQLHGGQIATATALTASSRIAHHSVGPADEAPDFDWHNLTLVNGWIPLPPHAHVGRPAFAIVDGIVYFRGAMRQPSPGNPFFAVLPSHFRLAHILRIAISVAPDPGQGIGGTLRVTQLGNLGWQLEAIGPQAPFFASLAGVSFPLTS